MKSIKLLLVAFLMLMPSVTLFSQEFNLDLNAKILRNNGAWKKNTSVNLKKFVHNTTINEFNELTEIFYLEDDKGNQVEITSKVDDCFEFTYENIQQFWDASIITNVLYNLKKKGFQYALRSEMENDALDYIQKVKNYNLEFNDPYLETYIYSLVAKIAPTQLIDGRPVSINLLIQSNPSINACCYPNGTIVLNTGLLAALHSEDELVAILAHEISHFILDHSIQNINKAIARQKRAEFWAAVATGLTAVSEANVASKNEYYVPGAATVGMAVLSTTIASKVIDHLGMNYNHEQEKEADMLAVQALKILGYDENALATALSRLEVEYIKERNNALYIHSYTHPSLVERIESTGKPSNVRDTTFEKNISFAVSNVAHMKYSDRRFRQCLPFVTQNIENGVASADDYILKANCLLCTKNDETSNNEVIALIEKAKTIDKDNVNIDKASIIAALRVENKSAALDFLNQYILKLESYPLNNIKSHTSWDAFNNFVTSEKNWAKAMIVKLSGM